MELPERRTVKPIPPSSKVALVLISDLEFGGAQRQVVELCNHMDEGRWDMHVCSLSDYVPLADSLARKATRFHQVLRRSRFDWTVVPRLARLLRKINADVVHCFLFDAEIAGRLAGRMTGRAVIGSERNTNYTLKRLDYIAYKLTGPIQDLTIANSSAGAEFNSRTFGLPRAKYRVVHNGVDTERFRPGSSLAVRQDLGIAENELVIGMFGSFKPQKNHSLLLRAARLVLDKFPDARFLFVGDELHKGGSGSVEFKAGIQQLVDDLRIRARCLFVGNRPDVERYYSACDLTALPSLFEGTPNVALESMACGVPIVATDVSDNTYVIPDGKAGFIVPLGDEKLLAGRIMRLLENGALRTEMGQNARQWVLTEFTGKRLAEKTAAVYDEALRLRLRN
jgi:glycosyltransferase involved in cell wall biosynthesis